MYLAKLSEKYYTLDMVIQNVRRTFKMQVTKETLIGEMLRMDMNIAHLLMGAGMHCVGCPSAQMESLEEACMVHGINCDTLVSIINEYLEKKNA